jgi:hypothetical protein
MVRDMFDDVDGIIVRLCRVNGDADCDANAAIRCCAILHTHFPHIKAWTLHYDSRPRPRHPSSLAGRFMIPPTTLLFSAASLPSRRSRSVSLGLVAPSGFHPRHGSPSPTVVLLYYDTSGVKSHFFSLPLPCERVLGYYDPVLELEDSCTVYSKRVRASTMTLTGSSIESTYSHLVT